MMPLPTCIPCLNSANPRRHTARFLAAQSLDGGKTITWTFICAGEMLSWNDGGNWDAPIYQLVSIK